MYIFAFFIPHQQINGIEGRACSQQFVDQHCGLQDKEEEEKSGRENEIRSKKGKYQLQNNAQYEEKKCEIKLYV